MPNQENTENILAAFPNKFQDNHFFWESPLCSDMLRSAKTAKIFSYHYTEVIDFCILCKLLNYKNVYFGSHKTTVNIKTAFHMPLGSYLTCLTQVP